MDQTFDNTDNRHPSIMHKDIYWQFHRQSAPCCRNAIIIHNYLRNLSKDDLNGFFICIY